MFTNVSVVMDTLISSAASSIELGLTLLSIYMVWLGVLKIVEDTSLHKFIAKLLDPIISRLFSKDISASTKGYIALNITSNLLGMGNASTPSGISAIKGLDKGNIIASHDMIILLLLNVVSIQIVPTTILGIRSSMGSLDSSIMLPMFLTSLFTLFVALVLANILKKICKR